MQQLFVYSDIFWVVLFAYYVVYRAITWSSIIWVAEDCRTDLLGIVNSLYTFYMHTYGVG